MPTKFANFCKRIYNDKWLEFFKRLLFFLSFSILKSGIQLNPQYTIYTRVGKGHVFMRWPLASWRKRRKNKRKKISPFTQSLLSC